MPRFALVQPEKNTDSNRNEEQEKGPQPTDKRFEYNIPVGAGITVKNACRIEVPVHESWCCGYQQRQRKTEQYALGNQFDLFIHPALAMTVSKQPVHGDPMVVWVANTVALLSLINNVFVYLPTFHDQDQVVRRIGQHFKILQRIAFNQ